MRVALLLLYVVSLVEAFVAPKSTFASPFTSQTEPKALFAHDFHEPTSKNALSFPSVASTTAAFWSLTATIASADSPDWGIFEGRIGSLLHPTMMVGLLTLSVYTAVLGFNWRRQRTIGDDITALKKTLPNLGGASSIKEAIAAAKSAESVDYQLINKLEAAIPIQQDIDALTAERKELSQGNNRDRHFSQGTLLAFLGTAFAIEVRNDDSRTHRISMIPV
jgi:Protein of unknown function (DUF4079)